MKEVCKRLKGPGGGLGLSQVKMAETIGLGLHTVQRQPLRKRSVTPRPWRCSAAMRADYFDMSLDYT